MSHPLGNKCGHCGEVLVEDGPCPERGCEGFHGYGFTFNRDWMARTFGHRCDESGATP